MKIIAVIPARYQSTRFPGKPLADICGKPMLWWVYQQVSKMPCFDQVVCAIDDPRIEAACIEHHMDYVLTRNDHPEHISRIHEVATKVEADYYMCINGDEPLINTDAIIAAIPEVCPQDVEFGTNIITQIDDPAQVLDASNIKMVFDDRMNALYMSRTPIPYPFKSIDFKYYKHVGIIGYNKMMLDFYKNSKPGRFEQIEGIDTLRFLDYGKQLKLSLVPDCHSLSVDTQKDLDMVIKMMKEQNRDGE